MTSNNKTMRAEAFNLMSI